MKFRPLWRPAALSPEVILRLIVLPNLPFYHQQACRFQHVLLHYYAGLPFYLCTGLGRDLEELGKDRRELLRGEFLG